jgi:hypothetical protein
MSGTVMRIDLRQDAAGERENDPLQSAGAPTSERGNRLRMNRRILALKTNSFPTHSGTT